MKCKFLAAAMTVLMAATLCVGCGSEKNVKQQDTKQVEQQVENNANLQKTYQEKEFDLGFQNKTAVKLESNDEKNLFLKIDEESINLSEEKDLYFNFNFCKLKAKDLDADGIKEILVLFYGEQVEHFRIFAWLNMTE